MNFSERVPIKLSEVLVTTVQSIDAKDKLTTAERNTSAERNITDEKNIVVQINIIG